jgi:hypothetical protein
MFLGSFLSLTLAKLPEGGYGLVDAEGDEKPTKIKPVNFP